ncbi:hypothetical protein JW824_05585 [bacterium]|nr:hypothetical protein [bacterium]RQV96348.1 MAG: hypothetical protein EH221_05095 [bacterium]
MMRKNNRMQMLVLLINFLFISVTQGAEKEDPIVELQRDIVLLNLVNGLYLTTDQTETLIQAIERADEIKEDYQKEINRWQSDFQDVLEEIKDILLRGEELPEDLKKQHHEMKKIQFEIENEFGEKLAGLESEVTDLLTLNQLTVIDQYKPCTIPPYQGKIGQSVETAAEGIVRLLERIRMMPDMRYERMKEMLIDSQIELVERHIGFQDQEEKEAFKQTALDIFAEAKALSDQEFIVQKGEMARSLLPEDSQIRKYRKNELGRVGQFLLDSALLPILKNRLNDNT